MCDYGPPPQRPSPKEPRACSPGSASRAEVGQSFQADTTENHLLPAHELLGPPSPCHFGNQTARSETVSIPITGSVGSLFSASDPAADMKSSKVGDDALGLSSKKLVKAEKDTELTGEECFSEASTSEMPSPGFLSESQRREYAFSAESALPSLMFISPAAHSNALESGTTKKSVDERKLMAMIESEMPRLEENGINPLKSMPQKKDTQGHLTPQFSGPAQVLSPAMAMSGMDETYFARVKYNYRVACYALPVVLAIQTIAIVSYISMLLFNKEGLSETDLKYFSGFIGALQGIILVVWCFVFRMLRDLRLSISRNAECREAQEP